MVPVLRFACVWAVSASEDRVATHSAREWPMYVCVLLKRKKQKARPKGVNLKVRWRAKVAMR